MEESAQQKTESTVVGNMISAARFTGYLFSNHHHTQHSSAGLFSNVRFTDFIFLLSKTVATLSLTGVFLFSISAQTSAQEIDVIKTETDLTNLLFTVTDKNNRYL